jgi:hypothetical protein
MWPAVQESLERQKYYDHGYLVLLVEYTKKTIDLLQV